MRIPRFRRPGGQLIWIMALGIVAMSGPATLTARAEPAVHGEFSVEVVDLAGKEGDDEEAQALELRRGPKVVASYPASGYVKEAYWSPEGKWVAVNVRDANSGDYIWVLEVASGALVRKPSDEEDTWETAGYAAFKALDKNAIPDNMLHFWKNAIGWTEDGKLNVVLRADYAEGAGRFDYIVPMTVGAGGLTPGEAKVERVPDDE